MPPQPLIRASHIIAAVCFVAGAIILWRSFIAPPPSLESLQPTPVVTLVLPPIARPDRTDPTPGSVAVGDDMPLPTTLVEVITTSTAIVEEPGDSAAYPAPVAPSPTPTSAVVAMTPTSTPAAVPDVTPSTDTAATTTANTAPPATSAPTDTGITPTIEARDPPPVPATSVPIPTIPGSQDVQITLRVESSAPAIQIYYTIDQVETILSQPRLPWSITITVPLGTLLEVIAENLGETGSVSCAIEASAIGATLISSSIEEPRGVAQCQVLLE
ncbi:MAG TPA: hypothetical protein PKA05_16720 [Roseiflexaceae bacterium]|nr:hypothetical protein [Roseiflexaceae bacterium]HMP42025.1 hypothetical protein [Roseiflexaceae bacterium]